MGERNDCFLWSGMALGAASVVMYGFSRHEGKKAKQLQQALAVDSVSEAVELGKLPAMLVAVRGKARSDEPVTGKLSSTKAVLIEEIDELSALKQNDKGVWVPEHKPVRQQRSMPKWFISDDGHSRVEVEDAFDASGIDQALTSNKQFREGKSSAYHRLISRLSGYQPLGIWETERSLPVGTAVTVVGELARSSDGKEGTVVRKPTGKLSGGPFYITPKSFEELQDSLMKNSKACKWLSFGFGAVSLALIGIQLWRHVRSTIRYRRIRKQLAEEEKRRRVERAMNSMSPDERDPDQETRDRRKCIICWEAQVDAAFIPCGHVCACLRCSLELNRCPICRKPCNVHRIYYP